MRTSVPIYHISPGGRRKLSGLLCDDGTFIMHRTRSVLDANGAEILKHYYEQYGGYSLSVDVILQIYDKCKDLTLIESRCDGTEHVWRTPFADFRAYSERVLNNEERGDWQRVLNLKYWKHN